MKRRNRDVYTSGIYPWFPIPFPCPLVSLHHMMLFVTLTRVCISVQFPPWSPATQTPPWQERARPRSWTAQRGASSPSSSAGREVTLWSMRRGTPAIPSPLIKRETKSSQPLRFNTDYNFQHNALTPKMTIDSSNTTKGFLSALLHCYGSPCRMWKFILVKLPFFPAELVLDHLQIISDASVIRYTICSWDNHISAFFHLWEAVECKTKGKDNFYSVYFIMVVAP